MWMLLVLLYGVLKGAREIVKKKALTKSSVIEVLFFYTLLGFLFVTPQAPSAMGLEPKYYFWIALKSFVIFLAWICSFKAISLYGVLDLSRVLFATLLGVVVLQETLNTHQMIGLVFVSAGLLLLKFKPSVLLKKLRANLQRKRTKGCKDQTVPGQSDQVMDITDAVTGGSAAVRQSGNEVSVILVLFAFASCMLNAVSGLMDKLLMKNISSSQLQFWYMLFLVLYYLIYILCSHTRIRKEVWKNGWIWLLAILFVIADKALFVANGIPDSRITIMTLLKQSGCVVTILAGKFIFREKNVGYKLFCAAVIVIGIVIGVS
jgi:drug/metabolite transporter (DMT)-like permease